jgi:hypothetical protein
VRELEMAHAEEENGAYAALGSGGDEESLARVKESWVDAETTSAFPGSIKYLIWNVHLFIVACYATPIIGAFLSDCVLVRTPSLPRSVFV